MVASTVTTINLGYVNAFYVPGDGGGGIIIDTGDPGKAGRLLASLGDLGVKPRDIQCIIITHAHADHYGSLSALQDLTGAKVLASRTSAEFMARGKSEPVVAQTFFVKLLLAAVRGLGRVSTGMRKRLDPDLDRVQADLVIDDDLDLRVLGVEGRVIHTPGHTRGSLSVFLDSGDLIIGDTVVAQGLFAGTLLAEDRQAVKQTIEKIISMSPRAIYLSHGRPCDLETIRRIYRKQFASG